MTWTVAISLAIGCMIKLLMSPPSAMVGWILNKFALHPKLNPEEISITFNEQPLEEREKIRFINYFNDAAFLKEYDVFPGNEKFFLHPETTMIPFVINIQRNNKDVHLFVYRYDDHVDVVKQYKEKIVSYSLRSDCLQKFVISTKNFSIDAIKEKSSYTI
ncbi:YfmQ family protein [Pseudobacillus wudalianchiensis]|uniref:Uncharacterized protein n=1 Tax=Pseudobacillus wudalianchiensis TaxID=1743143 RepID=A0A1B9AIT4_9BACI|nr:YfmQ family protein [Bacillus wudalianchiensis]OCA83746.1 hypothetical protein A8F95_12135 [Bacillus wudalianchiensis]